MRPAEEGPPGRQASGEDGTVGVVVPSALCPCWPSPETALIRLACGHAYGEFS